MTTPFAAEHMAAEISRLRVELEKANAQSEHFERQWYLRGDEIEALNAKLGEQASAPDGFVMVPAEPTDAMKLAGNDALAQHWGAGDAYRAMLAASRLPVQPVQGMSNRSKRLDEIRAEAERFFEWPGDDRSTVTLTSCILFADHIAVPSAPAAQGWILVSERLPEIATDVLVYGVNHGSASYTVAGLFSGEWASQETEETTRFEPTHWMPLPSVPKGGE